MTREARLAELHDIAGELRALREALAEPLDRVRAIDGDETWQGERATSFRRHLDELTDAVLGSGLTAVAGGIESAEHVCALHVDALERDLVLNPS